MEEERRMTILVENKLRIAVRQKALKEGISVSELLRNYLMKWVSKNRETV